MDNQIDQQIIVPILGMHRSGTSMVARMLNLMGVDLGEPLQGPSFDNPRGFWENRVFQAANLKLLEAAGCNRDGFDRYPKLKQTGRDLGRRAFSKPLVDSIAQYTQNTFRNTHWGWKDPRTVITWPFWEVCLKQLGYTDIRPIVLVRHPVSCAHSLKKRGDFNGKALPAGASLEAYVAGLWKTYYEMIYSYLAEDTLVLMQEDLLDRWTAAREMQRCAYYIRVPSNGIGPALATIDVGLISHRKDDRTKINDDQVRQIYETFVERAAIQRQAFERQASLTPAVPVANAGMVANRFCIYVVSPSNYIHARAFEEHALALHYGFYDLGYIVPIVHNPWEIAGTPIVLGANLLPHLGDIDLPPDSILYNLEQIQDGSPWLRPAYIDLLRRFQVWDYSRQNIRALKKYGTQSIKMCRVGYVPELTHIPQLPAKDQDIDVMFYGSLNARRTTILNQLQDQGLNVGAFFGVYGSRRDHLIARAKIVINIHFYESKVMEIVRLSYLMANKKFVISERGNDPALEGPFEEGLVFVDYGSLVETCLNYLDKDGARDQIAARGYTIFSTNKQSDYLKEALTGV